MDDTSEEEYLERDFEYKTPDELQTAVEMKVKETRENKLCFSQPAFLGLIMKVAS